MADVFSERKFVTEDGYTLRWNGTVWTDGSDDWNGTPDGPVDGDGDPLPGDLVVSKPEEELKSINDFTDAELAGMIRRSAYAANARFGKGQSRFLLVLAVPYGDRDGVDDLPTALDSFFQLVRDFDYEERYFEVYDHNAGQRFFSASLEEVKGNREVGDAG